MCELGCLHRLQCVCVRVYTWVTVTYSMCELGCLHRCLHHYISYSVSEGAYTGHSMCELGCLHGSQYV